MTYFFKYVLILTLLKFRPSNPTYLMPRFMLKSTECSLLKSAQERICLPNITKRDIIRLIRQGKTREEIQEAISSYRDLNYCPTIAEPNQ